MSSGRRREALIPVPEAFDLVAVCAAHGWPQLPPFDQSEDGRRLRTVLNSVTPRPLELELSQCPEGLVARADRPLGERSWAKVAERVGRIGSFDVDLRAFHRACRKEKELAWIPRRRLGRFLRAETPFEDLAKVLLTTNCTWVQTKAMVGRLVEELGETTASGARAFPTAARIASCSEAWLKDTIRVGYRAGALLRLAQNAEGIPSDFDDLPADDLGSYIRGLAGFGPYAARAMQLVMKETGPPVIDSWALARARELYGEGQCAKEVEARYLRFGEHAAKMAWFDLNQREFRAMSAKPSWA